MLTKVGTAVTPGVSKFKVTYVLIKQARLMGANKLVMQLLERLRGMRIPPNLATQVEISAIAAKAYPYRDPEELLPLCYRCSSYNPLLPPNDSSGELCVQCGFRLQYSFVMFGRFNVVFWENKFQDKYT